MSDAGPGRPGSRAEGGGRRGNVRGLLLAALLPGPAHGYELMRRLQERSGGRWRPSPGSVYPLLQLFEDEGLVRGSDEEGRKVYELTAEGRQRADESAFRSLDDDGYASPGHQQLHAEVKQLHQAARQVGTAGAPGGLEQAVEIVRTARQALYRLLADQ